MKKYQETKKAASEVVMKHRHSGVQKRVFQEGGNDQLFQIP